MKKIALASAIALASITAAHAAPTVYGKVLPTIEYTNTDYENSALQDESTTKLVSNSSRIGFKGDDDLTDTTKLVYQLEYGIDMDADTNGKGQFYSRNTFIGLSHNTLGTVLAGRHDTPFKLAKGSVDVFNDYDNVALGNLMYGENRVNNVLAYKSPSIVGMPVTFMAATSLSENDIDSDYKVNGTNSAKNSLGDALDTKYYTDKKQKDNAYSLSLAYDQNGAYLAGGYDKDVANLNDAWRIAGSLDMGKMNMVNGLTVGALYQNAKYHDSYTVNATGVKSAVSTPEDEESWLLSAKYKVGETPWAVKAQYIDTSNYKGAKDVDANEIALGAEYAFNKAAKAHMYAAQIKTDSPKAGADIDKTIVGAGLEYKF